MSTATIIEPSFTQPSIELVTVTPSMAAKWLEGNAHNRPLSSTLVESYARDMANGRWMVNGEAIQIGVDGTLLNGQHRLSAVVDAGVNVDMLIVSGLPMAAQDTMDIGRRRQVGDVLALAGIPRGSTLAAVTRVSFLVRYGTGYKPTDAEMKALIENDQVLQWIASDIASDLPTDLIPLALAIYAYRRFYAVDSEACAEFFNKLKTLDNLPADSPILALHRRLSTLDRKSRSSSWRARAYLLALVFVAWNAWRGGEARKVIKTRPGANGYTSIPDPV